MNEADELVAEASIIKHSSTDNVKRHRKLVKVFDQLSDCLCKVADMVRNIYGTVAYT